MIDPHLPPGEFDPADDELEDLSEDDVAFDTDRDNSHTDDLDT